MFCKRFKLFYTNAFFHWSQGFVISDWQGIDRITTPPGANYSLSVYDGIHAGIDMVVYLSLLLDTVSEFSVSLIKDWFIPMIFY